MNTVTWQGTDRELTRLQQAVERNCTCVVKTHRGLTSALLCGAHDLLRTQAALDHLLYVYRMRRMFITREFYALPEEPARRRMTRVTRA